MAGIPIKESCIDFYIGLRRYSLVIKMRSTVSDITPPRVRRSLVKFGADLSVARRKRQLTVAMMAERIGVSKNTYSRMELGAPNVAMGAYAMALFVLGFGEAFGALIDSSRDDVGLILDTQKLPQRVRIKKTAQPL